VAYSPFVVKRPGIEHGRIVPSDLAVPEGDFVAMLGADSPGWEDHAFRVGDKVELYQSDSKGSGDVLGLQSTVRSPSRMPALSHVENFALADGQTLLLSIDGGATQTITFNTADFADIANARAVEVRDVLNAALVGATAAITGFGQVSVLSDDTGRHKRVQVVGGTATALRMYELAWYVEVLINSVVVSQRRLRVGETRALSGLSGNLAAYSDPVEVKFRLRLGVIT
jgi:hypothetical protein